MEKINIRTDLSIADQVLGVKQNSDGLWYTSEIKICGKPTEQAVEEIGQAMLDMNKKCDIANTGREPLKTKAKKVVRKTVESTDDKPGVRKGDLKLKKPKKKLPEKKDLENKKLEISGGKPFKSDSGEKGKNLSG